MSGLFEDDANVRRIPKVKKKKEAPATKREKKSGVGNKLVARAESKSTLVKMASGGGSSFTDVDITKARRASVTRVKKDKGRIQPPINYISDEDLT